MRCSRRPSAAAAATTPAGLTPRRSRAAKRGSNRCPPGGAQLIDDLAALLGRPAEPLDPSCGKEAAPLVAWIDEPACIGCARCLDPCPTDAILGARKRMHTVIAADCSGCELCVPACPVDCIHMIPAPGLPAEPLPPAAIAERALHSAGSTSGASRGLEHGHGA